jgi:hypothetical protein
MIHFSISTLLTGGIVVARIIQSHDYDFKDCRVGKGSWNKGDWCWPAITMTMARIKQPVTTEKSGYEFYVPRFVL